MNHSPFPLIDEIAAALGWLGAIIVLLGYALMVSGRLASDSARYLTCNLLGSLGLAISTVSVHAWQSALVNVLWLAFGVMPLWHALGRRQQRKLGERDVHALERV